MPPRPEDPEAVEAPGGAGDVVVIGSSVMDVIGRPLTVLHPLSSAPGLIRLSPGGVARNVAENLARLGVEVTLITAVGDDPAGRQLLEQAESAGVNVLHARTVTGERTGMYLGVLDPQGNLQFALDDMDLVRSLSRDYLLSKASVLEQAQAIFLDANVPSDALAYAVATGRRAGVPLAADPTSVSLAANLRPHLKDLWLITPNAAEAEVLCPHPIPHPDGDPLQDPLQDAKRDAQRDPLRDPLQDAKRDPLRDPLQDAQRDAKRDPLRDPLQDAQRDPLRDAKRDAKRDRALDAARQLVAEGVEIALVTMAEFGVGYASAETSGHVPAVKTEILDSTGAGDAQTAAVLFGLLNGIPLDESVRLGASAAALTLRTPGSVMPDLSLERLYDELR